MDSETRSVLHSLRYPTLPGLPFLLSLHHYLFYASLCLRQTLSLKSHAINLYRKVKVRNGETVKAERAVWVAICKRACVRGEGEKREKGEEGQCECCT